MEKLVLVPYVKYQRMLEMTHHPKTYGDSGTSDANISPTPKKKTKRKVVDSDEITGDVSIWHKERVTHSGTEYHSKQKTIKTELYFYILLFRNKNI